VGLVIKTVYQLAQVVTATEKFAFHEFTDGLCRTNAHTYKPTAPPVLKLPEKNHGNWGFSKFMIFIARQHTDARY